MDSRKYERILRILGIFSAVVMLWISARFSVAGFNIVVPGQEYIGWMLAAIIIVIEVIWNRVGAKAGLTLFVAGVICYLYGVYTNVVGVRVMTEFAQGWQEWVGSLIFGLFLEIVPEPLFVWGLTGVASDPLSNLASGGQEGGTYTHNGYKPSRRSRSRFINEQRMEVEPDILERLPRA